VLLSTTQLPYTAHNRLWMFPILQLQLVVCNVCQTQTPFSQTTTAALSVGRLCTYTNGRNKHQCCYLSIFALLSLFWNEKKNVRHYFLSNLRTYNLWYAAYLGPVSCVISIGVLKAVESEYGYKCESEPFSSCCTENCYSLLAHVQHWHTWWTEHF
jgi:hypothetical protein